MRFAYSTLSIAIFSALSATVFAETSNESKQAQSEASVKLSTIVVEAKEGNEVGKTVYSKENLQKTPNSSKNTTDFLKVNPNVQFNDKARSGLQQGELNPLEISINGGLPYDNKFLINGISINNNINPVGQSSSNHVSELMGSSQTVSVNTDLLCNITLLDSNVSAEYGEFTGGVVSAETCAPTTKVGEIHGSINYDYTSDNWSKINFDNQEDRDKFEDSISESNQPYFTKQGTSANLYGKLTDHVSFNTFGSYRKSDIPLKTSITSPTDFEQKRESTNGGVELFYTPSEDTTLKVGAQFMESSGTYFLASTHNSESVHASDSKNIYFNLKNKLNNAQVEQQLNYQTQTSSREGEKDNLSWKKSSTKNWRAVGTQIEGSFGSMEQQEEKLEYSIKALFNPIQVGDFSHIFKVGTGYGHYEADWERPEQTNLYASATTVVNLNCSAADGSRYDGCDEGNGSDGQYFTKRTAYNAGEINVRQDRWHAYIEDSIQWNDIFSATLGLRSDYDSLTKENNFAPRSAFSYQPFGSPILKLSTGWNRYYGLNSFANELQAQRRLLQNTQTRTSASSPWIVQADSQYSSMQLKSQLETPYSDETILALSGQLKNIDWALKWVNRDSKKLLRTSAKEKINIPDSTKTYEVYTYENSGESKSDVYTLSVKNIKPVQFAHTLHRWSLAADYTDTLRNFNDYSDSYQDLDSMVYYDNTYIKAGDRPADNYNVPWTVRLGWDIAFDNIPLNINNFLSYKSSNDVMKYISKLSTKLAHKDEQGNYYDTYIPYENKSTFTWDMRTTYQIPMSKNYNTILGLTINNVTNKKNMITDSNGATTPEIGRQFIADVTFKF